MWDYNVCIIHAWHIKLTFNILTIYIWFIHMHVYMCVYIFNPHNYWDTYIFFSILQIEKLSHREDGSLAQDHRVG